MKNVLFAAPKSGSGKTMITCGFINLLKKRNMKVCAFKCGPDYIDPMFHRSVLSVPSGNLDIYLSSKDVVRDVFARESKGFDISVTEGVMGYYDGLLGASVEGSTYEIAGSIGANVILVVDGKGASVSLAASIKGIIDYKEDSRICGIILNRVSEGYYDRISGVIEESCGIPVFGFVPDKEELKVPERHLGLVAPFEVGNSLGENDSSSETDTGSNIGGFRTWIDKVSDEMEKHIDVDRILAALEDANDDEAKSENALNDDIAEEKSSEAEKGKSREAENIKKTFKELGLRIAVARDEAFSFMYRENIEILEEHADLVYFSPLRDKKLPENISGLVLYGGYPELYAKKLSENVSMREDIRKKLEKGMPFLAECGGFLYLQKKMTDALDNSKSADASKVEVDEKYYPMVGFFDGDGITKKGRRHFGYAKVHNVVSGIAGDRPSKVGGSSVENGLSSYEVSIHEFHKLDCTENGEDLLVKKTETDVYSYMNEGARYLAGFPHFYYPGCPWIPENFIKQCAIYAHERKAKNRWDKIAKPIDSLGLMEDYIVKLDRFVDKAAALKPALVIMCADHGVVKQKVTQTSSDVTKVVAENFAKGKSTVNILAGKAGCDVYAVDVGMDTENYPEKEIKTGALIDRKVRRVSGDIMTEPAMTRDECLKALNVGIEMVKELKGKGYNIVAMGEMGIGNTTPTSALAAFILKLDAALVTGRGAGLSDELLENKINVIEKTLKRLDETFTNEEDAKDFVNVLAQIGGLEIAAMAGLCLGGAMYDVPIVLDGAISAVAALCAYMMDRSVSNVLFASHKPKEKAGEEALKKLGLEAVIDGRLCLGEGTGAMMVLPLIDMAFKVYREMGSFEDYSLKEYERFDGGSK